MLCDLGLRALTVSHADGLLADEDPRQFAILLDILSAKEVPATFAASFDRTPARPPRSPDDRRGQQGRAGRSAAFGRASPLRDFDAGHLTGSWLWRTLRCEPGKGLTGRSPRPAKTMVTVRRTLPRLLPLEPQASLANVYR